MCGFTIPSLGYCVHVYKTPTLLPGNFHFKVRRTNVRLICFRQYNLINVYCWKRKDGQLDFLVTTVSSSKPTFQSRKFFLHELLVKLGFSVRFNAISEHLKQLWPFFYQIIWVITVMNILPQCLTLSPTVRQTCLKEHSKTYSAYHCFMT